MKKLFINLSIVSLLLFGCSKQETSTFQQSNVKDIKEFKDSVEDISEKEITNAKFNSFDWEKVKELKDKNNNVIIIVPSKFNKNEFIIATNNIQSREINLIEISKPDKNRLTIKNQSLINREITINNFINGKIVSESPIKSNALLKIKSMSESENTLPNAVVTGYLPNGDLLDLHNLFYLFNRNQLYANSFIVSMDNSEQSLAQVNDKIIYNIDFNDRLTRNKANIQKLKNCLDALVPSVGATYKVELCTDIPVNEFPNINFFGTEGGHAFLQISKSNGIISETRSFGFYPSVSNVNALLGDVESVIKEDNEHEYNAKISMELNESQFNNLINYSINLSNTKTQYNLYNYNCVNFALDCFNSVRATGNKITAPMIGQALGFNTRTPSSLFSNLTNMKNANTNNEALHISINTGNSSSKTGQCN